MLSAQKQQAGKTTSYAQDIASTKPISQANSLTNALQHQKEVYQDASKILMFSQKRDADDSLLNLIDREFSINCDFTDRLNIKTILKHEYEYIFIDCANCHPEQIERFFINNKEQLKHIKIVLINAVNLDDNSPVFTCVNIRGLFLPCNSQSKIIEGLEKIFKGSLWLPRSVMENLINQSRRTPNQPPRGDNAPAPTPSIKLTNREKQILLNLSRGQTNVEIANVLNISSHTVRSHIYNIFKKIGVKNRLQANVWATRYLSNSDK
jgi:LuxR family transcriptional regulator of csgAB operon